MQPDARPGRGRLVAAEALGDAAAVARELPRAPIQAREHQGRREPPRSRVEKTGHAAAGSVASALRKPRADATASTDGGRPGPPRLTPLRPCTPVSSGRVAQ